MAPPAPSQTAVEDIQEVTPSGSSGVTSEGEDALAPGGSLVEPADTLDAEPVAEEASAADVPEPAPSPVLWAPERKCIKEPLTEAEHEVFFGSAGDDPPPVLNGARKALENKHYLASDEWNLHLYQRDIQKLGVGGAYVGIGTDQAYFFIGWMQPQLAWAIDYDPLVVELHGAYAAFFKAADTKEAFLSYWKYSGKGKKLLKETYQDDPQLKTILRSYGIGRRRVWSRLSRLLVKYEELEVKSFINNRTQYRYVRDMVRQGCVRSMLGNLLADKGLTGIGAVTHELGIPVRVLYLSNSEMYWSYKKGNFKNNIGSLNVDGNSLILRTYASMKANEDYRYNRQAYTLFLDYLANDWVETVHDVLRFRYIKNMDDIDYFKTVKTPEERLADKKKKAERKRRKKKEKKKEAAQQPQLSD